MKVNFLLKMIAVVGLSSVASPTLAGSERSANSTPANAAPAAVGVARGVGQWQHSGNWSNCRRITRQGYAFEIQNAEGKSMIASCTDRHPKVPFDWQSGAKRYRIVVAKDNGRSQLAPDIASFAHEARSSNGSGK